MTQTDHQPPTGPGCGQWGSLAYRGCMPDTACRSDNLPVEATLALYDRIDEQVDAAVADACAALNCRPAGYRNDENHFECAGSRSLCMSRSLLYRCADNGAAPATDPDATGKSRASRFLLQQGVPIQAGGAPADLALHGPLRLGGHEVDWGGIVALGPDSALASDDGRCRFRYRYEVTNLGAGPAGEHVNQLRRDDQAVVAENSIQSLEPGAPRAQSGTLTLWTGQHVVYVELDTHGQVDESDTSNNLRRIRADVAEGCADPRPQARPPGGGTRSVPRPTGRHAPPEPRSGSRAPTTSPPRSGSRAPVPEGKPAPQGKPAPGTSKPVPADGAECKPMLTATRHVGVTRTGARTTAIAAWEASALAMYGSGFSWESAHGQDTVCSYQFGWRCTVKARPCRG